MNYVYYYVLQWMAGLQTWIISRLKVKMLNFCFKILRDSFMTVNATGRSTAQSTPWEQNFSLQWRQNFGVHTAWRKARDRGVWLQVVSTATLHSGAGQVMMHWIRMTRGMGIKGQQANPVLPGKCLLKWCVQHMCGLDHHKSPWKLQTYWRRMF